MEQSKPPPGSILLYSTFFSMVGSSIAADASFVHLTLPTMTGPNVRIGGFLLLIVSIYFLQSYLNSNMAYLKKHLLLFYSFIILLGTQIARPFLWEYYKFQLPSQINLILFILLVVVAYYLHKMVVNEFILLTKGNP